MGSHTVRRTAVVTAALLALAATDAAAASAQPDLVVKRASVSLGFDPDVADSDVIRIGPGSELRVAERTRNVGGDFAGRSATRYYLRATDGGSTLLGSRSVEALVPGGSSAEVTVVRIAGGGKGAAIGAYRLLACADGGRRVAERNERNNCRAAPQRIVVRDNALPAVFIGGGAATGAVVTEDGDPVLLAPSLTVTDADGKQLTGATASILGGAAGTGARFVQQQYLDFVLMQYYGVLGISGTYNTGTGVLTLTGNASAADYQLALRSIWVRAFGDDPRASRTATIRVRDALGAWSRPARQTITVNPVNDAPAIGGGLAVWDPDSRIGGASVAITQGFSAGHDQLGFNQVELPNGITSNYNSGTGVLTLTGTAPPGAYQTALRAVRLTSTASGQRQLTFRVKDADGAEGNAFILNVEALP